jgi:cytochrome o ubiquinol oxidase subunit IV
MSHGHHNPIEHPEVQLASTGGYLTAFVFGLGSMLVALWLIVSHAMSPVSLTTAISLIALVAAVVQMYFLFKLDLSATQIWHTVSLVMTLPLFIMAVGLTIWMFHTLMERTMLPGVCTF